MPAANGRRTARATAPAARVYSGPSTAAATAGPAASSGSMPHPGPITTRETPTAAMIANGSADSISDALDRPAGLGLLVGVSALVLVVTIPPQLVVKVTTTFSAAPGPGRSQLEQRKLNNQSLSCKPARRVVGSPRSVEHARHQLEHDASRAVTTPYCLVRPSASITALTAPAARCVSAARTPSLAPLGQ